MNKQNLHNIVSSIQMSPRDKNDLIKELKSNNVHCIEIFDSNTFEFRSVEDVYKEYENNKDKFIIGSCDGLIGILYPYPNDYSFSFVEAYYGELYSYCVYYNTYDGLDIYEEYFPIGTIFIDANNDTLSDYTFDDLINDRIKLILYNGFTYTPISSMMNDKGDCLSFLLYDNGGFHSVDVYSYNSIKFIDLDFDFSDSETESLRIEVGVSIEGLENKLTNAIRNGIPIFIGANNAIEQVLEATCYGFDYGTVYLYTKTAKYECTGNQIILLNSWNYELVKVISDITAVKYDDLLNYIKNNYTIIYSGRRLTINEYNTTNIKASALHSDMNHEPIIGYYIITKNETTGNCKILNHYNTNELKHKYIYIKDTINLCPNDYSVIVPTKDIFIKFNTYYSDMSANYTSLNRDSLVFKYVGEIQFSDTVHNITFDNILWSTDSILDFKSNHVYCFEIQNGFGVMKEFVLPTE